MIRACALFLLMTFATSAYAQQSILFSGDIRLREQLEEQTSQTLHQSQKLRLRLDAQAQVLPDLLAEIRLATAKSNRSTNQTLGDSKEPGSPRRYIGLDLAFAKWKALPFITLYAGKFPQLHFKPGGSQIILDEDITLEGGGASLEQEIFPYTFARLNGGTSLIRENYDTYYSMDTRDISFNWAQFSLSHEVEDWNVHGGFGFFNFAGIQNTEFADLASGGTASGNTLSLSGQVLNKYLAYEYFVEAHRKWNGFDVSVFYEWITNHGVNEKGDANWVGVGIEKGAWDGQVAYADVEADSVPAVFTHSDFANGYTASKGFIVSARWKFKPKMALKLSEFINDYQDIYHRTDYMRTNIDLTASF